MNDLTNGLAAHLLRQEPRPAEQPGELDYTQLIDLDQVAAMVHLARDSLRRYVKDMPPPFRPGKRGRKTLWEWSVVRPWLIETFGVARLPERFPNVRRRRI